MASSSSRNWLYDVFPSFRGEEVRKSFLSHFHKELNRKMIITFKDNEVERSQSIWPQLVEAIRSSNIAMIIFSKNYASSSWCLNELLEIVKCQEEFGQKVIPVYYNLDPSHVRKQTDDFGKIFEETCKKETEEVKIRWRRALSDVANISGYHYVNWYDLRNHYFVAHINVGCLGNEFYFFARVNEAKMIEEIANDVLSKLLLTRSNGFDDFVGIEGHISRMIALLQLESKEVRIIGIWGSSGIGKTTIARVLFNLLSQHFQGSIFIDNAFVSQSKEVYRGANADDYNMKLHLQENFLSKILWKEDIKIDHLGALEDRLKRQTVLIFIDDLDDEMVLEALANRTRWFGSGSRIIVITNNKHLLTAHGIDHIYEVLLPSVELAVKMLSRSAFKQDSPRKGFEELVFEIIEHAGCLPLGLKVLGRSLQGRNKEYWMDKLSSLQNSLDVKIEKTLRICYDGLSKEDKLVFRYVACILNGKKVEDIKLLLADSVLGVSMALENLVDRALIHIRHGHVEMHRLLQQMGREINRTQSIDEPGKREFLVDSKDICDVLQEGTGTKSVLGILLNIDEIDGLLVHESAFKEMHNLRNLEMYTWKLVEDKLQLPESFDHLPPKLKQLIWPKYPMRCMPSKFHPERLVKLKMRKSNLERLWEGVPSLTCLKEMDLFGSKTLKEIPDLSMATNLEKLNLEYCQSLVELPPSIRNLNKLIELNMRHCHKLETLPTGINLKSLDYLNFDYCGKLRTFPEISTNISRLRLMETNIDYIPSNLHLKNLLYLWVEKNNGEMQPLTPFMITLVASSLNELWFVNIPNLVELPSSIQNLNELKELRIINCINLETLPTGINLKSLEVLCLRGCSRLRTFPNISTNILDLDLGETGIEEVPCWIEKFSRLKDLDMNSCFRLKYVHLNISKLKHLYGADFSKCGALTEADLSGYPSGVVPVEASSSFHKVILHFTASFGLDQVLLPRQHSVLFASLILPGEEVPSYFTHRASGISSTVANIPFRHASLSLPYFIFRVCVAFTHKEVYIYDKVCFNVNCHFKGRSQEFFSFRVDISGIDGKSHRTMACEKGSHLVIWDCHVPLSKAKAKLYDHVDMQLHVVHSISELNFGGWGIRILEDCSSSVCGDSDACFKIT